MSKYVEEESQTQQIGMSRRKFVTTAGLVAVGGALSTSALGAVAAVKEAAPTASPPLPWKWAKLDPQEAGKRTYEYYHAKGG